MMTRAKAVGAFSSEVLVIKSCMFFSLCLIVGVHTFIRVYT